MTSFPYIFISNIAKNESWRKEVNRPIYHLHKWWAQRLGTVFRAISIHLCNDNCENEEFLYSSECSFNKVIYDPFMGSGTTLGENLKIGNRVVGCDINPVSAFLVEQALTYIPQSVLKETFSEIEKNVKYRIQKYYKTVDPETGEILDVLYYFWVKTAITPNKKEIPLFSSFIFSKNAYPSKKPDAKVICPKCWSVFSCKYNSILETCPHCCNEFNPQRGFVSGEKLSDGDGGVFKIKDLLPEGKQFEEKLFALLAIDAHGKKKYLRTSEYDIRLFNEAKELYSRQKRNLGEFPILAGYNSDQARGYNYLSWEDLFNERQSLVLSILADEISRIENPEIRRAFSCLFSTMLEFNNRFCSFKGEGTGAVRPMFSNHILKPERVYLENNVWGTKKNSGSFSTMFSSKFLRAKQYLDEPFDLIEKNGQIIKGVFSKPLLNKVTRDVDTFFSNKANVLLLNGDSSVLDLPAKSVDAVITDPPYFDFINYSELSDFFYGWLKILNSEDPWFEKNNSRRVNEVQNQDMGTFARLLEGVFRKCFYVLKDNGRLSFSFHHSKPDGWVSIANALKNSGFYVFEAIPVYSELMASNPKNSASEPICLDIIFVCGKKDGKIEEEDSELYIKDYVNSGYCLSKGDLFVIRAGQATKQCVNNRVTENDAITLLSDIKNNLM